MMSSISVIFAACLPSATLSMTKTRFLRPLVSSAVEVSHWLTSPVSKSPFQSTAARAGTELKSRGSKLSGRSHFVDIESSQSGESLFLAEQEQGSQHDEPSSLEAR